MPGVSGTIYAYDGLEFCPVCREETPHNTGMIGGGKACLVCGVTRQGPENRFRKCDGCSEWIPAIQYQTNGDKGLVPIPMPKHKCKSR